MLATGRFNHGHIGCIQLPVILIALVKKSNTVMEKGNALLRWARRSDELSTGQLFRQTVRSQQASVLEGRSDCQLRGRKLAILDLECQTFQENFSSVKSQDHYNQVKPKNEYFIQKNHVTTHVLQEHQSNDVPVALSEKPQLNMRWSCVQSPIG